MYLLSAIRVGRKIIFSRGSTQREAVEYMVYCLPRGVTYEVLDWVPIEAAKLYNETHGSDWLHRMPRWMQDDKICAEIHNSSVPIRL
tara:strand:+ start:61 stop:321 length:261 start_codon:yes stop_codon:yes gene_type:complete